MQLIDLDGIVSSHSKVRCLRLFSQAPAGWFSEAQLAADAKMSRNTVNLTIGSLEDQGVVEREPVTNRVRLNAHHPLAPELLRLFQGERQVWARLAKAVEPVAAPEDTVLLAGSGARADFDPAKSDIDLIVVRPDSSRPSRADEVERALRRVRPGRYRTIDVARDEIDPQRAFWKNVKREAISLHGRLAAEI